MTTHGMRRPSPAGASDGGRASGLGPRAVARAVATVAATGALAGGATIVLSAVGRPPHPAGAPEHVPTDPPSPPVSAVTSSRTLRTHARGIGATPVRTSGTTYGYVPAWLGHQSIPVGRVVTATLRHPWLAIQGDTVRLRVPRAQALVTVVGPQVPEQGRFPVPMSTRCTFTVTIAHPSAPIALDPRQFWVIDEQGRRHTLHVTSMSGGRPARAALPGRPTLLRMTAVLPVGQGDVAWAPVPGAGAVIRWDFDVEID